MKIIKNSIKCKFFSQKITSNQHTSKIRFSAVFEVFVKIPKPVLRFLFEFFTQHLFLHNMQKIYSQSKQVDMTAGNHQFSTGEDPGE